MAMLNNVIRDVGEQLASCPLGQIVFRFADRILWTFEMSIQWFMKKEERKGPLIRPLPWILFLPFLLWLRFVKIGLTLISFIRGKETLPPTKVASYIQIYRRRLRGVKYAGLKNFTNWRMAQEEKKKGDGECIIMKLLGIYWLSAFTGIGRVITPVSSSKDNQEQLKPKVDESSESSETEHTMVNLNQMCEESNSEDDPDYDPLADKPNDSEDTSDSSDSSNASTVSLETAEAGSESTSQTFHSSSNITPEPTPLQVSHSAGNEPEQSASVEEIPCQTSPDNENTQEKSNHVEENQREQLPSSQNGSVSKQIHDINKPREESIICQKSSDTDHETMKPLTVEKSQIDMRATQNSPSTEQIPEQTRPVEEKQRSDSSVLHQTLTNTNNTAQHALSIEEKSIEDLPQCSQVTVNVKPLPDQSTPIEEISDPKQISSSLVEERNENPNDNKQLKYVNEVDSNFQEVEESKAISSNIPNIPQSTETVEMETSEIQLPNPENNIENSVQKLSETSIQKDSESFLKEELSSNSRQKYDANLGESEQRNKFKELVDKQIQPDFKNEPIEEMKRLSASAECVNSVGDYQVPLGNPSSDFINSEISVSSSPFRKSDSAIASTASTEPVKEVDTEDTKLKRRFSDFFITKRKT